MTDDALRRASRLAYAQRMNKVLDHIDRHLDSPLDLPTLAEIAHFSAFHFHRVFAAWMGETLGDYLRRRRIEGAALLLAGQADTSVLDIALAVGFGSGEALARPFKQRFGCTPTQWRLDTPRRWADELAIRRRAADRNPDQAPGQDSLHHGGFLPQEFTMNVKLVTLPPVHVAYLRHIGPYGPPVNRFWNDIVFPWLVARGLERAPCYGISHDDPGVTAPEKCRYDACVEVPADFVATSPASLADLAGGRYAVAAFTGDAAAIELAWTELLRDWLPASGMQVDNRPCFEHYPTNSLACGESTVFSCELCLPVKPL